VDLLALAAELSERGEPFVLATVVRCERPTSAKPGAKALIRQDGSVTGWVGGACAEPVVVREALAALRDGEPRLIGLIGEDGRGPGRTEGILEYPMTCHSGGTLEIYVEPFFAKPALIVVGQGPVVETLARLGAAMDFAVTVLGPGSPGELEGQPVTARASIVIATHGTFDEAALEWALRSEASYVSLVASRKRAAGVLETLKARGMPLDRLGRLRAPAGLDIGATAPEEIAVSIVAEIVQARRSLKLGWSGPSPTSESVEAIDPICGMRVDPSTARFRSEVGGRSVSFCCLACKERFDREPR